MLTRTAITVILRAIEGKDTYVQCRTKADVDRAFRECVEHLVGLGSYVVGRWKAKPGATPTVSFDSGGTVKFYSRGYHIDGTTAKRVTLDEFECGDF